MNIVAELNEVRSIVPLNMGKKQPGGGKKDSKKLWVFEPDEEMRELMGYALAATGKDRSEIIVACIRLELENVVKRHLEEQKKAEQAFLNAASKKQTPHKGK